MTPREAYLIRIKALADMIPNFTLSPELLRMYEHLLCKQYGYERVCKAVDHVMMERDSRDPFPSMKQLREIIEPKTDPESDALVAANLVIECVSKYGWSNPDRAKDKMGELAWSLVAGFGGWTTLCESLTERNAPQIRAQLRDLARAKLTRAAAGLTDTPRIQVENKPQSDDLQSMASVMKKALEWKAEK